MEKRKRTHDEYESANLEDGTPSRENDTGPGDEPQGDGGKVWQTVEGRSKKRKRLPKQDGNSYPSITHSPHARLQASVKIGDLQNLALYLLADGTAPQWCSVRHHANVRKVVVLLVPGLEAGLFDGTITFAPNDGAIESTSTGSADSSGPEETSNSRNMDGASETTPSSNPPNSSRHSPDDYYPVKLVHDRLPEPLQPLSEIFEHLWPCKTPGDDRYARMHSSLAAMLVSPIVKPKEEKNVKGPQYPPEGKTWRNNRTPITELLSTTAELAEEGYVMHPAHYAGTKSAAAQVARREANTTGIANGWVDTPSIPSLSAGVVPDMDVEKGSITAGRKVLAMDCEMCLTSAPGANPLIFSLTRISLIDWDGNTVLDELVKPAEPITDYLTPYSGITAAMLGKVSTSLQDIQQRLLGLLTPQTILIGHSLNSDLNALKLTHPFIVDTALLFPHPRGLPLKSSLKWLAQKYLQREIQEGHGSTGHDSIEDARACLDLVKQKCEKGKAWGTSEASGESIFKRLGRQTRPKREKVNPVGEDEFRVGAVVDWGDPTRGYGGMAKVAIGCESDVTVVAGVQRAILGDEDEGVVPKGGCDFTFARLRELEAHRGWWNISHHANTETLLSDTTTATSNRALSAVVQDTVKHISEVWDVLPSCAALIVYSGSGDPRELSEMQALQARFKEEYRTKKWDELSVRWTDVEEQKLRKACGKARKGIGLVAVK